MNAQQLRNSILQEAIEGRLVPQDPNDEPASTLLQRIRAEKERLVKEGKLKKKDLEETPISEDEKPFEIPESWEWVRMQDVIEFVNGRAYKRDELLDKGKYKVLRVGNFFTNDSWYYSDLELPVEKYCYKDDLLYAWSASFGPKIWDGDKTIFHYHIWNVKYNKNILFRDYLFYFFLIDKESIKSATTGSTMVHVSMENMKPRLLPLPPLAEQKRIVAKIEELLPKVEEYGKAQEALDKLNEELPEKLKKSILQEAIEGRLVKQDPNDEPASALLAKIREEKKQLVKEGKLKKKDLEEKPISEDEIPFEIPDSWEWVRLGTITTVLGGKRIPAGRKLSQEKTEHIYIRVSDMKESSVSTDNLQYVPDDIYPSISRYIINKEDVYITVAGTIGRIGKIPPELDGANLTENADRLVFSFICQDWLIKCLQSMVVQTQITDVTTQVGQPKLAIKRIQEIQIPLPPLAEQKRIVEKIEQLFKEIDKLKK